ncbi:MAG: hypothetical protein KAT68_05035 [Bacteroidales bacterium]|nr:hypothetical protein [Bacteroidales bacterium]
MIRKITAIFIILSCFNTAIIAQDSLEYKPHHLFVINTGYSKHIIRDDIISPLIYKGAQAPIVLNYKYFGNKNQQAFTFYYDKLELYSSITKKINNVPHSGFTNNFNGLIEYTYNKKIYTRRQYNSKFFIGGKLLSFINFRDYYYKESTNAVSLEQMTSVGLNLLVEKKFNHAKNDYLHFNMNIPLFAYVILNERYNVHVSEKFDKMDLNKNIGWQIFKNGNIVTFNKLFEFQTELSYSKFISKHLGFEIKHRFHFYSFYQYKDLFQVRYVNNQYLIGLVIII